MDEKDLQIFLTLADTGNLTRTAEKLYLAQPTLSKRLQNMESELGATLFLRSKQGVTLTPAGEEAQKVIQRTVQDFSTLREQLQLRKNTICGTLRIEVSIDYSKYRLPQVLAAYTAQCPDVTLRVSTNHSRDCLRTLQDSSVHLAIVRGEYDWDEGKILLEREPVCLIRSRENASVPLRELRRRVEQIASSTRVLLLRVGAGSLAEWLARLALLTSGALPATLVWLVTACSLKNALQRLQPPLQYAAGVLLGMLAGLYACAMLLLAGAAVCLLLWPLGAGAAMMTGCGVTLALRICAAAFRWSLPKA